MAPGLSAVCMQHSTHVSWMQVDCVPWDATRLDMRDGHGVGWGPACDSARGARGCLETSTSWRTAGSRRHLSWRVASTASSYSKTRVPFINYFHSSLLRLASPSFGFITASASFFDKPPTRYGYCYCHGAGYTCLAALISAIQTSQRPNDSSTCTAEGCMHATACTQHCMPD